MNHVLLATVGGSMAEKTDYLHLANRAEAEAGRAPTAELRLYWNQLAADYRALAEWLKLSHSSEDFKHLS